jgi:hypothetical protein
MHPILMHEIARYRQADLLREAERARLAHLASSGREDGEERRRFTLRRRTRLAFRPALDH